MAGDFAVCVAVERFAARRLTTAIAPAANFASAELLPFVASSRRGGELPMPPLGTWHCFV
jgi:hypothetical protein